jgi:hypothetical protein
VVSLSNHERLTPSKRYSPLECGLTLGGQGVIGKPHTLKTEKKKRQGMDRMVKEYCESAC